MGIMVMVAYRPKPGGEEVLRALIAHHATTLRKLGLVTDRHSIVMRSADGAYIEIFEWVSQQAVDDAHENVAVARMWQEFAAVADYEPIAKLPEASEPFAHFEPVQL